MRAVPCLALTLALAASAQAGPTDDVTQPGELESPAQVAARVDTLMEQVWSEAKIKPSAPASDAEFLRRASLDVDGAIPSEDQTRRFLLDKGKDKRERLIAELLADPGYSRTMALRWSYLLVGREYLFRSLQISRVRQAMARMQMQPDSMGDDEGYAQGPVPPLVEWLEQQLQENTGWDQVTRDLLTAQGDVNENGAAHYILRYARDGKAAEITGNSLRVFQGLQLQCAQCHDHPYTDWTQRDFWGVAAFFSRLAARRQQDPDAKGKDKKKQKKGSFIVFERPAGQIRLPAPPGERGALALPRFIDGTIINPTRGNRREALAKLITAADNPWFAKATVNRIWSFFFGRGLSSPVDDLEVIESNPAPQVFALLEEDFRKSGYDVRRLCEVILRTQAYQRSSIGDEEGRESAMANFARAPLRTLSAEQLFYSVLEATGAEDINPTDMRARRRLERMKYSLLRQFLQTFADDEGQEVVQEGTIPQALLLLNGPLTNDAVRPRPGHPLYDRLFAMRDPAERVQTIYLRTLSRPPTKQELKVAAKLLGPVTRGRRDPKAEAQAYADLVWALLNEPEFAFNH